MNEPSQTWWENIVGPSRLKEQVQNLLQREQSVALVLGTAFSWRESFRGALESHLFTSGLTFHILDCADDYTGAEVGEFLLNQIDPGSFPNYLQCLDNKFKFLKENHIFSNQVIWLKGVPQDQRDLWLRFIRDFNSKSRQEGLFVLELDCLPVDRRLPQSMTAVSFDDYVTPVDLHLFTAILAAQYHVPTEMQAYISSLVTELCITDGEVAEKLIRGRALEDSDPVEVLRKLLHEQFEDTPRGTEPIQGVPHPFALLRAQDEYTLRKCIWKAQLKVAFPIIEMQRIEQIQFLLNDVNENGEPKLITAMKGTYFDRKERDEQKRIKQITQNGSEVVDPYELELSTIVLMTVLKKPMVSPENPNEFIASRECLLYLGDEQRRQNIFFLRDMRNKLAHIVKCENCTPEEMHQLLTL